MSVVDDRRIEDLERVARSLTTRVARLEREVASQPLPMVSLRTVGRVTAPASAPPPVAVADGARSASIAPPARVRSVPTTPPVCFEDLLGGRMLAWLGGVAVVIGIALFFGYAISRGWIGEEARALGGGVLSLTLFGLGVWLHGHRGRTDAARTLVAVAVVGLFMTVDVASRVYAVVPVGVGFALALACGAAGAVIAVRWKAKVIGAIGIVGALLAPVLVGAPTDGATLVVLFAAALSAVGVLLWCRWDWLGFAVPLVCAPQWLLWLLDRPGLAGSLLALVAFGTLGHVAAIGFELRLPEARLRGSSSLLFALNAAVLAIAGDRVLASLGHPTAAGLWVAGLAAGHVALGLLAGRGPRVSADIRLLLLTLGVLLGDAGFALLAHGPVLAFGWAVTSVAFARLATRHAGRSHDQRLAELGLGGHIAGALVIAVTQAASIGFAAQAAGDQVAATLALAAVAAAASTSARLTAESSRIWRAALDIVGLGVAAYLTALNLDGAELVVAWALEGVALATIAHRTSDELAAVASLTFLAAAVAHVLAVEAPPRALVLGVPDVAAAAAALGICAVASLLIARARLIIKARKLAPALIGATCVALLYLASVLTISAFQPTTLETGTAVLDLTVRQQGQMLLSGLWGLAGVAALILGLRRDQRLLRLSGLGALLMTAGKVFLYDLSTLDSVYRIASFIALGLLLLGGAYAYQRMRPSPVPDLRSVPRALR